MLIRLALPPDAPAIAHVQIATWNTTYRGLIADDYIDGLSQAYRETRWRATLNDPAAARCVFVAENDEREIVGFACGGTQRTDVPGFDGELYAIYLLTSYQRHGVGEMLTRAVAGCLLQVGFSSMLVWVLAGNSSRAFYESLGGQLVGEQMLTIGAQTLLEVAYGWPNLTVLAAGRSP